MNRPSSLEDDLLSSLAEFKAYLKVLENDFLEGDKLFLEGSKASMADIHVAWAVRAGLESLDILKLPGFDINHFPKTQAWKQRLPKPEDKNIFVSMATERILSAEYVSTEPKFDERDSLQLEKGTTVGIEMSDDLGNSGRPPQLGRLWRLNATEVVIELENGIRMHFPRRGVVVRKKDRARSPYRLHKGWISKHFHCSPYSNVSIQIKFCSPNKSQG